MKTRIALAFAGLALGACSLIIPQPILAPLAILWILSFAAVCYHLEHRGL